MQARRFIARLVAALALVLLALSPVAARAPEPARFLVVYTEGEGPPLGEMYAVFTANLLGRWGRAELRPAAAYQAGELERFEAVAVIGAAYDAELPAALLADVAATERPVLWMQHGVHRLAQAAPGFRRRFGWRPLGYDAAARTAVTYRGRTFTRRADSAAGLPLIRVADPEKARVLATVQGEGAAPIPWAVESGRFVYLAEAPYAYLTEDDRYVAFAALLQKWIDPDGPERHRALVRIEDVGPEADPARLRLIADKLYAEGVPFSVTVYDTYRDPTGRFHGGRPTSFTLKDRPLVVQALRYMAASGGTLVMHGHTHQSDLKPNPFARVSGGDYEFYGAAANDAGAMALDGPLPHDAVESWTGRMDQALAVWRAAGLPRPGLFTTPHYAASPAAYQAILARFPTLYEHVVYYPGERAGAARAGEPYHQLFPYPVRDVRGAVIVPENLGRPAADQAAAGGRTPEEIVASAERNLVVRDGFASFYRHWYLDPDELVATVRAVRALGYTFVSADAAVADLRPAPPPAEPARPGLSLEAFLAVLATLFAGAVALGTWAARRPMRGGARTA